MQYLNTKHRRNVRAVLTVGIVRSISCHCGHHTAGLSGSDVCHLVIHKQHSVRYDQWHWAAALFNFRWNFLCSYCSITYWQHRSDRYSVALYTESDESSWLATSEISKVSSNVIPLIYNCTLFSEFQKKFVGYVHFTETSHTHHKSHSPKAHCNFLHPPVNFSILSPNISLRTIFLNCSLQSNR